MSWHLENVGTPEEVSAAIDEAVAMSGGMPASVGAYLKDAIAACVVQSQAGVRALVSVTSTGHRPIASYGSNERAEVKLVRSGPFKPPSTL